MSVGKTTLLEMLKVHPDMAGIEFLPESATQTIVKLNQHPLAMTQEGRANFQQLVLENQIKNEQKPRLNQSSFISDRGVIDGLTYSYDLSNFQSLITQIKDYLVGNPYTHIIYLPIEFKFDSTGRELEDNVFQKETDTKLVEVLKMLNLDYYTLTGSRQERVDKFLEIIKK